MNSRKTAILSMLISLGLTCFEASAQSQNTFGARTYLCVKRVGRTADGSNNRGRDAFLNPTPCPKGYFTIDLLGLVGSKSVGEVGPVGPQGPQGPRGPGGGFITGRLVNCPKPVEEQASVGALVLEESNPCTRNMFAFQRGFSGGLPQVIIPGESFVSYPNNECRFRISNVPVGTYNLAVLADRSFRYDPSEMKNATVAEGTTIDLGDIPLCEDYDGDGYDFRNDCNEDSRSVNPGVAEECNDSVDNNCNGEVDEGCVPVAPTASPTQGNG